MAFKSGDKVKHVVHGEFTISDGPIVSVDGTTKYYILQQEGSQDRKIACGANLTANPDFKVGDEVTYNGSKVEIVYGPFRTVGGEGRLLIKFEDGIHRYVPGASLSRVLAPRVGDTVRVTSAIKGFPNDLPAGKTGILLEIDTNDSLLPYKVKVTDGWGTFWVHGVEKI